MKKQKNLPCKSLIKSKKLKLTLAVVLVLLALLFFYAYYYALGVSIGLIMLLLIVNSRSCCCEQRAKYRPHKVRLIAYSNKMIYLEAKEQNEENLDTPFASYQYAPDTPLETAQKMIDERFCGVERAKPRALINYCTRDRKRGTSFIVHLFVVHIENANDLHIDCKPSEGKWWDVNHLDSTFAQSFLSSEIKEELPCLKETILLAESLQKK